MPVNNFHNIAEALQSVPTFDVFSKLFLTGDFLRHDPIKSPIFIMTQVTSITGLTSNVNNNYEALNSMLSKFYNLPQ